MKETGQNKVGSNQHGIMDQLLWLTGQDARDLDFRFGSQLIQEKQRSLFL